MRCPKCGYISFDHLDNCRKCHKPTVQSEFKGTTYPVLVPIFLQPSQEIPESGFDENMVIDEDMVDVLDPDLDLLAENNDNIAGQSAEREISIGDDFEIAFNAGQEEDTLSLDEDDFAIDISRFADVPVNMQAVQETQPAQFAIPEGLADISDLARPVAGAESKSELAFHLGDDDLNLNDLNLSLGGEKASVTASTALDDELALLSLDDIDLSGGLEGVPSPLPSPLPSRPVDDELALLSLDDIDLSGGLEVVPSPLPASLPSSPVEDELALLSLDDIDLSGGSEVVPSPPPASLPSRPVEDDLNFDLDLGTLEEEKVRPQKNKSDDLPELTLSLD